MHSDLYVESEERELGRRNWGICMPVDCVAMRQGVFVKH